MSCFERMFGFSDEWLKYGIVWMKKKNTELLVKTFSSGWYMRESRSTAKSLKEC